MNLNMISIINKYPNLLKELSLIVELDDKFGDKSLYRIFLLI